MKLVIGLVIFSLSGFAFSQESGLSEERQIKLIDSLQNYEPLQNGVMRSTPDGEVSRTLQIYNNVDESCPEIPYEDDKYCLEKKYISDGYYKVSMSFKKLDQFAEQPRAPHIKGVTPFTRDTTARDAYLNEVSDAVFKVYIGEDYSRFNHAELVMINANNVIIELQVREAIELQEVLRSPHINYVEHIGSPQGRLEEIAD